MNLGIVYHFLEQYQQAVTFFQQSLEIKQAIGDKNGEATSLIGLGNAYNQVGRAKEGFEALYRASQILQKLELL